MYELQHRDVINLITIVTFTGAGIVLALIGLTMSLKAILTKIARSLSSIECQTGARWETEYAWGAEKHAWLKAEILKKTIRPIGEKR